jgi:aspartate aminotransferase-like enzyme
MTTVTPAAEFGTFFLPGPTEVRPAIRQAMAGPMISHRGSEFRALVARVQAGLRVVFGTDRPVFIATSSATGLMEAAIRNAPPGPVLALVNGGFSERFANVGDACGRVVDRYEVPWGSVHDAAEVTSRLRAGGHRVVSVVHSETSTGALNDVRAISDAAHAAGAVCVIDSVSGVRGAELRFDEWRLDYVFTGSQKAMALPPGLAFAVASERFLASGERDRRGVYFDLAEFATAAARDETPNTPAISLYYALDLQLESVLAEGMAAAWARHAGMAARTAAWAAEVQETTGIPITPLAPAGHRSPTVTAIVTPAGATPESIVRGVAERGYTIGGGYGKLRGSTVRIGHMGDHTLDRLDGCLEACAEVLQTVAH